MDTASKTGTDAAKTASKRVDCFRYSIKMEYQKIKNLLDTASDNVP